MPCDKTDSVGALFVAGDPEATEDVRRRVRRILNFKGYRILREDRVDLEQAVMLELWQAVARPEFDPARFWGFVEVVTARRCIDQLRKQQPIAECESASLLPDPGPGPLGHLLAEERAELADAALARLPSDCRELVDQRFRQQLPWAEIAERRGRTEGSLRVRMHRCLRMASGTLLELVEARIAKESEPGL